MNVTPNDHFPQSARTSNGAGSDNSGKSSGELSPGQKIGGTFVLKQIIIPSEETPVWLAEDELLGKDVALHFLPKRIATNEKALRAIVQEVKRTRQLAHRYILRVYDLIEEGENAAISTEKFDGQLFTTALRERAGHFFEPTDAKPLLRQVFQTLVDAHKISAVHGSVALENMILTPDHRVILRHFGTGRLLASNADMTNGTSPSTGDDVRALGAVVYEMLSGVRPQLSSDPGFKLPSMMEARARAERRGGTILPIWEKAVADSLSADPAERPASVTEFGERLGILEKRGIARQALSGAAAIESEPLTPGIAAPDFVHPAPGRTTVGHSSAGRTAVPSRTPWIPEGRLASGDDLDYSGESLEPAAPFIPISGYTPLRVQRARKVLGIASGVLLFIAIALGGLYLAKTRFSRSRSENVVTAGATEPGEVPPPSRSATTAGNEAAIVSKAPGLSPPLEERKIAVVNGTSIEDEIRKWEAQLRAAEEAEAGARRLAEEQARAASEARLALAALRSPESKPSDTAPPVPPAVSEPEFPTKAAAATPEDSVTTLNLEAQAAEALTASESEQVSTKSSEPSTEMQVAKLEPPATPVATNEEATESITASPESRTSDAPTTPVPGENSLGMRFVPVGDVQFCIWPTRVQDYATYAKEVRLKSTAWRQPGFKQQPDHPVIRISWNHATAFCKWLTEREHGKGTLPANEIYRLPTDLEWSLALGLQDEPGSYPSDRDGKIPDVFPWGNEWPPEPNSGNYNGQETGERDAIIGYKDGFTHTSPVGSFPANQLGLFDIGGNVWQWCGDLWRKGTTERTIRGGSYQDGSKRNLLWSSARRHLTPDSMMYNVGFRVVRAATPPPRKKL
jgi:formylglycine-generating enzyme required for sulfatase activity